MKTFVVIGINFSDMEERKVVAEFRDAFPFAREGAGFRLHLPSDDPRIKLVLEAFEKRGIPKSKAWSKERPKIEYSLDYHRTYEATDLESALYLKLKHERLITEDQERDETGRLKIEAKRLRPGLQIGCVLFNATVVSEALRQEMLKAGLAGVQFKELLAGEAVSRDFWELVSSVILPPMPRERLICRPQSPGDYLNVAGISDGDYFDKEIHLPESGVRRLEPFDFALTHEIFGDERWPIASQRFRQFCRAQKLKVSWTPVRLDAAQKQDGGD